MKTKASPKSTVSFKANRERHDSQKTFIVELKLIFIERLFLASIVVNNFQDLTVATLVYMSQQTKFLST